MDHHSEDQPEIVFFDVETIYSTSVIVEFGAILVCPSTLTALRNYSTLVRPDNPSLFPPVLERRNGITRDALADAPTFADIADTVYELLHERMWAGHNISGFDCIHIRKAFSELNRPPPEPRAIIDSLPLLTETFGRRAGDMKMASLATYFGLGRQTHRSLDDVRMNLEVIKCCATIMFLESSFPSVFRVNGKSLPQVASHQYKEEQRPTFTLGNASVAAANNPPQQQFFGFPPQMCSSKGHELIMESSLPNILTLKQGNDRTSPTTESKHFDLRRLRDELNRSIMVDEKATVPKTSYKSSSSSVAVTSSCEAVLNPDEILISCLTASLVPLYRASQRIQLLHEGVSFQLCCTHLKIRFGINGRFLDYAGRPKLSFVVDLDPSQTLCKVLEDCDKKAQRLSLESGSSSEWRPVITRKDGFFNYYTLRLQIPAAESGNNAAIYATEIYRRESSSTMERLVFDKFDVEELGSLLKPDSFVDAVVSLESYDYQQNAGIRLIAKRLIVFSK